MKYTYKTLLSLLIIISFFASAFALKARAQILPEQNPIVIIPGIMGSWNWDVFINNIFSNKWDFFALDHTFDNLLQALEDEGFVRDQNLFIAFYDWRKPNAQSANDYLIPKIDSALANSASGKVDIIAHSMGGLVARSYIQNDDYRGDVGKFIMLGTPNYGSSDVYSLWEGGLVPKNWGVIQKNIIDFYLWYMTTATSQTADFYDTTRQYIPSVGELLPTYDYLIDANSGELKPVSNMTEQNPLLNTLNTEDEIASMLSSDIEHITVIAGIGENTVNQIPVIPFATTSPQDAKLWADGIPEPNPPAKNDTEGDNRVIKSSAFLPEDLLPPPPEPPVVSIYDRLPSWLNWFNKIIPTAHAFDFWDMILSQFTIPSKHGDLPTEGISKIFDALEVSASQPLQFTPVPEPQGLFSIWLASPVAVVVTDPDGNIISKDINDISNAIYDGESDPAGVKMIIIPEPKDGDYSVSLRGIEGGGEYHMAASHFSDTRNNDAVNTVEGALAQDESINYTVTLDSSSVSSPISIISDDEETEPKEISAREMIEALIADINLHRKHSLIEDKTTKQLIAQLHRILNYFDKFENRIEKIKNKDKKHREKQIEHKNKKFDERIIHNLKKIIHDIKKSAHKGGIETEIAKDIIQKIEKIIEKIKTE